MLGLNFSYSSWVLLVSEVWVVACAVISKRRWQSVFLYHGWSNYYCNDKYLQCGQLSPRQYAQKLLSAFVYVYFTSLFCVENNISVLEIKKSTCLFSFFAFTLFFIDLSLFLSGARIMVCKAICRLDIIQQKFICSLSSNQQLLESIVARV